MCLLLGKNWIRISQKTASFCIVFVFVEFSRRPSLHFLLLLTVGLGPHWFSIDIMIYVAKLVIPVISFRTSYKLFSSYYPY
jgi:hypothetical protein